jgi:hypothetical protein
MGITLHAPSKRVLLLGLVVNVTIFSVLVTVQRHVLGLAVSEQDMLQIMGGTSFGALFAACGGMDGKSSPTWRQMAGLACFGAISLPVTYVLGHVLGFLT